MPAKRRLLIDVYVRVSRVGGRDGENFISPDEQKARCRSYLEGLGYTVGETFTDLDQSGRKMQRPEFDKAMARIRSGASGGICVARLDRFARNVRGLLTAVEEIEAEGAAFICISPSIDTADPTYGRFLLTLFGAIAELESGKIKDAWAVAHANAIDRGVQIGPAPAGYTKGADGRLVLNEHAAAVRAAFEMRADGAPWPQVARMLTEAGVPTSRGNTQWRPRAAADMMKSRTHLGEVRTGNLVRAGAHEPLISVALFEKVNRMRGKHEVLAYADRVPALLAGMLFCETCGHRLVRDHVTRNGKRYDYYRCRSDGGGRGTCEAKAGISARQIEPRVVAQALERLGAVEYEVGGGEVDTRALEERVREAEAEIAAYVKHTPAATTGYGDGLSTREAARDAALEALNAAGTATEAASVFLSASETVERYEGMPVEAQRKVLGALIKRVIIAAGKGAADERSRVEWRDFRPEEHGLVVRRRTPLTILHPGLEAEAA